MYFSYLPIGRFDRQEKPFLAGPPLHVWGTFGSEGEENFWRNVPFRGAVWESWFQSHRESFHYSPLNAFRLFLGGLAYVLHKRFLWNEAQSRMDAYPSVVSTLGGGGPVGWPRMNLEMHLHLNSELASNEFLTEFAFKIRKIPSGFALVRQSREQATVGRTHASMSGGTRFPRTL